MLSKVSIYEKMLLAAQEDKDKDTETETETETIKHLYQQHTHLMNRLERLLCS